MVLYSLELEAGGTFYLWRKQAVKDGKLAYSNGCYFVRWPVIQPQQIQRVLPPFGLGAKAFLHLCALNSALIFRTASSARFSSPMNSRPQAEHTAVIGLPFRMRLNRRLRYSSFIAGSVSCRITERYEAQFEFFSFSSCASAIANCSLRASRRSVSGELFSLTALLCLRPEILP